MREEENDDLLVSKLLRLKRYEQPPAEYFDNFLREFQTRQRSQLLRRPAWRVALGKLADSVQQFMEEVTFAQLSYAGASFAVLAVAGVLTANMLEHPGQSARSVALSHASSVPALIASNSRGVVAAGANQTVALTPSANGAREFTLDPKIRFPDTFQNQTAQQGATNLHPRYILDARPVSYEPPSSF